MTRPSAINIVWLALLAAGVVVAAYTGDMAGVSREVFAAAGRAVELAIGLIGALALWLGTVRVAEQAGLMRAIARLLRPLLRRLFPSVPAEHPAMGAMVMNLSANMIGLGNAATPLGIKAMLALDELNSEKGTATDAMCLFLAINTSSVTLIPTTVMAVRASAGATTPGAIILPTLLATVVSTVVAVVMARWLARRRPATVADAAVETASSPAATQAPPTREPMKRPGRIGQLFVLVVIVALLGAIPYRLSTGTDPLDLLREVGAAWIVPLAIVAFLVHGYAKGVAVYESFTEGAREGIRVAVRIVPFLVAIFVAVGVFRASGAMEALIGLMDPVTAPIGMPAEVLPVALTRPLSGSGALGLVSEIVQRAPDSYAAYLASTLQGSTETTFYVLAVYFGAVGVRRTRHALPAALTADAAAVVAAVVFCQLV